MSRQDIEEERLKQDLEYVRRGLQVHALLNHICPPKPGLKVLEPGCGSGKLGIWYEMRGAHVTLVDIDEEELRYAGRLYHQVAQAANRHDTRLIFLKRSIHKLPEEWTNYFDLVFNEGVPQHWGYNPRDWRRQRSINEMVRVTKIGGTVCVIANNALHPEIMAMANSIDHDYKGMPKHEKPFTPLELATRLKRAGIKNPNIISVDAPKFEDSALILGTGVKE